MGTTNSFSLTHYGNSVSADLSRAYQGLPERSSTDPSLKLLVLDTNVLKELVIAELEGIASDLEPGKVPCQFFTQIEQDGDLNYRFRFPVAYLLEQQDKGLVFVPDLCTYELFSLWKTALSNSGRKDTSRRLALFPEDVQKSFLEKRIYEGRLQPFKVIPENSDMGTIEAFHGPDKFQLVDELRKEYERPDSYPRMAETIKRFLGAKESPYNYFRALIHWNLASFDTGTFIDSEILALTLSASYIFQTPAYLLSNDKGFLPQDTERGQTERPDLVTLVREDIESHKSRTTQEISERLDKVQVHVVNAHEGDNHFVNLKGNRRVGWERTNSLTLPVKIKRAI